MSVPATAEGLPAVPERVRGGYARTWARRLGRIRESKPALIGVSIIAFWVAAAALAPAIAPYPPNANDVAALAHPTPSGPTGSAPIISAVTFSRASCGARGRC